jgi:hypothetical protein
LLSCHDQGLTLDRLVETVKPSAFEEAEEPEPEPEKKALTVTKLTSGHGVTEGGVRGRCFERTSSSDDWTMDCEGACLLWEDFDRGEYALSR